MCIMIILLLNLMIREISKHYHFPRLDVSKYFERQHILFIVIFFKFWHIFLPILLIFQKESRKETFLRYPTPPTLTNVPAHLSKLSRTVRRYGLEHRPSSSPSSSTTYIFDYATIYKSDRVGREMPP